MVIFYHSDDDGKCAGYWAGKLNKRKTGIKDHVTTYIKINYGDAIPWDKIAKNELVYIVDFSFEPKDMDKLLIITNNVVWIDHHITAIDKYKEYPRKIDGIRVNGVAGCLLTYFYLTCMVSAHTGEEVKDAEYWSRDFQDSKTAQSDLIHHMSLLGQTVPFATRLIADWDVWKFELVDTKAFHTGFSAIPHEPTDFYWDWVHDPQTGDALCAKVIESGKVSLCYRQNWLKDYCKTCGFDAEFVIDELSQLRCYAINIGMISSDDFMIDTSNYDVLIGFHFDGSSYKYSLRAARPDVDVSAIAKQFGGGGHKAAAGFASEELQIRKKP